MRLSVYFDRHLKMLYYYYTEDLVSLVFDFFCIEEHSAVPIDSTAKNKIFT